MKSRAFVAMTAFFSLSLLSGCGEGVSRREAERLVQAYNTGLVAAYRESSVGPIRDLVTEKELRKLAALIDLKASNRVVLESQIQELAVTSFALSGPDRLVVETRELWRYFDRPLDPGRSPGEVLVADMTLRYEFVRERGKWRMDQGTTLACEYLEPKGLPAGTHRPRSGGGTS